MARPIHSPERRPQRPDPPTPVEPHAPYEQFPPGDRDGRAGGVDQDIRRIERPVGDGRLEQFDPGAVRRCEREDGTEHLPVRPGRGLEGVRQDDGQPGVPDRVEPRRLRDESDGTGNRSRGGRTDDREDEEGHERRGHE